jgi:hypothetical protein
MSLQDFDVAVRRTRPRGPSLALACAIATDATQTTMHCAGRAALLGCRGLDGFAQDIDIQLAEEAAGRVGLTVVCEIAFLLLGRIGKIGGLEYEHRIGALLPILAKERHGSRMDQTVAVTPFAGLEAPKQVRPSLWIRHAWSPGASRSATVLPSLSAAYALTCHRDREHFEC